MGLIVEWSTLHQQELLDNWGRAQAQQSLQRINTLE